MKHAYLPFFALVPLMLCALDYDVHFIGLEDSKALKAVKDASDLISLQDRPPASINALRYRVQADIPHLLDILKAYSYYDATIYSKITYQKSKAQVELLVDPGPQYLLKDYGIFHEECEQLLPEVPPCKHFSGNDVGLYSGKPALSVDIVNAELSLLNLLAKCGHPLAYIDKRKVEVDMAEKTVAPSVCIQEGPLAHFGPSVFYGLKDVDPRYIERRIAWQEGDIYNADLVEETQRRILKSNLFSSVLLNHGDSLDSIGELPMKIRLTEGKHRSVNVSVFYATVDGPGGSFGWTHRNMRGMGEIFSAYGEWSLLYWVGSISYAKPDFLRLDQTYKIWGEVSRENIYPYLAHTYYAGQRIERMMDRRKGGSVGVEFEYIGVEKSASNGHYALMGLPVLLKYNTTDSDLNPTKNYSIVYQCTPYQSLLHGNQHFIKQRLTGCVYLPLTQSKNCVFAFRTQFGSVAGARRENVPLPLLFLGGSLDDLRGYRYKTVSPRKATSPHKNKPFGGRSAIFTSSELRFKVTQSIGLVSFFDMGTVTEKEYPEVYAKWFKSVGVGLRYFAFFGPLRFDLAFPIDRRKKFGHRNTYFDPILQFYASVGQAF